MGHTVVVDERYYYLPDDMDEPATTTLAALKAGRSGLREDGRWIKRRAFTNPQPQEDPSTPFCDGWGMCAIGGVQMVTIGVMQTSTWRSRETGLEIPRWSAERDWTDVPYVQRAAYDRAVRVLDRVTDILTGGEHSDVVSYNDHSMTTHRQVMRVFDHAIRILEAAEGAYNA